MVAVVKDPRSTATECDFCARRNEREACECVFAREERATDPRSGICLKHIDQEEHRDSKERFGGFSWKREGLDHEVFKRELCVLRVDHGRVPVVQKLMRSHKGQCWRHARNWRCRKGGRKGRTREARVRTVMLQCGAIRILGQRLKGPDVLLMEPLALSHIFLFCLLVSFKMTVLCGADWKESHTSTHDHIVMFPSCPL